MDIDDTANEDNYFNYYGDFLTLIRLLFSHYFISLGSGQ